MRRSSCIQSRSKRKLSYRLVSRGVSGQEIVCHYQGTRFVNLICDTGTVQNRHTVDAAVTNLYCERARFVADLVDSTGVSGGRLCGILKRRSSLRCRMSSSFAERSLITQWSIVRIALNAGIIERPSSAFCQSCTALSPHNQFSVQDFHPGLPHIAGGRGRCK
jgi:hypothetical protein